jgi:hypothetical protein
VAHCDRSAQELHDRGDEVGEQHRQQDEQNHTLQLENQPEPGRDRQKQQDESQNGASWRCRRRSFGGQRNIPGLMAPLSQRTNRMISTRPSSPPP